MIDKRGRPKGSVKQYAVINEEGAIEDVYGTGVSFNVYRSTGNKIPYEFVQSCYKLQTALSILNNLKPKQAKPKWL